MFTYAVLSEVGEREINEDSVGFAPVGKDIGIVILADGLGGHGRGEDASALVTTASKEVFRYYYNQKDCLERCFMESQKRLMKKQADENARQDLKTTLVLLRIVNGYVQWGHVGDSRLYYFKNGKIVKRTLDHSVPQMLVAAGEIDEKEIRHHPDRNRLVRVMGIKISGERTDARRAGTGIFALFGWILGKYRGRTDGSLSSKIRQSP